MPLIESVGRVRRTRRLHLCECGCGQETALSSRTWARYGMVTGKPLRFVKGHNSAAKGHDLAGRTYGRLTAVRLAGRSSRGARLWLCICSCGAESVVYASALTKGHTQSCGCLRHDGLNARHGMTKGDTPHPIWSVWASMTQRCTDTGATGYKNYGGRGIRVCRRWSTFENFRDDMLPTWSPGLTLEREDNEGNYSPKNCKWATKKEQARNRRSTRWVEVFGERLSLAEAVERFSVVRYGTVLSRIDKGKWGIEEALTTP